MDMEAGTVVQVTFGDQSDTDPCWSPDGKHIAFISNLAGNYDLFVVDADGSGRRQLTRSLGNEGEPAWSPDGAQIAYVLETRGDDHALQNSHLCLISVDCGSTRHLTDGPVIDSDPDWSPDGKILAFERKNPDWSGRSIWLMEMPDGSATQLDLPADSPMGVLVSYDYPRWLPRGGYFLSVVRAETALDATDSRIIVLEVEQRDGQFSLCPTPASIGTNFFHYAWGPNGEWLIAPVQPRQKANGAYDLLRVSVSLVRPSEACWECGLVEGKFLTDDDFYDDYPDWAP